MNDNKKGSQRKQSIDCHSPFTHAWAGHNGYTIKTLHLCTGVCLHSHKAQSGNSDGTWVLIP